MERSSEQYVKANGHARSQGLLRVLDSSFHSSESTFDVRGDATSKVLPATSHQVTEEKSVRFSSTVERHEITHRLDMEEKQKKQFWYRKSDYKRIRREGRETVQLIRNGELLQDTNHHCLLGLDSETHVYARQRSMHKMMVQGLVVDEQEYQRQKGIRDPESLAMKIRDFDSRCKHAAFVAGLRTDRTLRRDFIN
jgi:hypothetical protein